jgi:hypothetical protein
MTCTGIKLDTKGSLFLRMNLANTRIVCMKLSLKLRMSIRNCMSITNYVTRWMLSNSKDDFNCQL